MEPILEQKTSNPSFPRMISPSETLSSLIASSKVKTYNKAPNSVHERLYSDSQIRKKSKIIQNKEHSRLKPKVNQTKGIEDRLFVKARALEAKRDRIREKWEWIEKQNIRDRPEINQHSKDLASLVYAKRGYRDTYRCSSQSSRDISMLYNLTDRPHDEKILSSTKNSGLSIKITEDLQSPPATSRRDLSITNQKPIKINDNNLTERYKTPKYDEIINIYKKTPKSLYNYQETFINPQETANVLKSKLQEMHKKLIEPNETESINRNDSKKSTQMNLASPKSDLSNVNSNFLRNGSKKSTRLSASSPKTTKEAYVKDLLSQTSRNSSPPSQHSAETAKPSNPPKRKLIQFPTKLQTQARITVNSSVPLETAYIYKEIIKRRCADDQHFKLTK